MKKYIAEIAGKDSIAAVMKFIRENSGSQDYSYPEKCSSQAAGIHRVCTDKSAGALQSSAVAQDRESKDAGIMIIPTIVYTGTEYGDKQSYYDSIEFLKRKGKENGVRFADTIYMQDGRLWNLLCSKYQYLINRKSGFYTPCVACHMFAHLMRLPLLRKLEAEAIITGERHSHQGRLKANQHPKTMECFREIFEKNGVNMIKPLLEIEDTEMVNSEITDETVIEHANDVKCVLSGNLQGFDLKDNIDRLELYLNDFLKPVGVFCAQAMLSGQDRQGCGSDWHDRLEEKIKEILI